MRYYFAPMEGVTGHLYRNLHHRYFPGVDKYFLPFLSPSQEHSFTKKAFQDTLPENNQGLNTGLNAVPQLLTRRAEDFIWAAGELARMGYRAVNLNLGCPSGTVTAKGKGSGFLAFPELLDQFLEEIFASVDLKISVKTRLGIADPAEFPRLLEIYNKYPITELIIHPRVRKDFYKNKVRLEDFAVALPTSRNPVCYNGNLVTAADCAAFSARFPGVDSVMLGRGLIANPALLSQVRGGPGTDKSTLNAFHDDLYQGYYEAFGSARNAMFRMKEVWFYLICLFADNDSYAKKLRKATDILEYKALVAGIFRDLTLLEHTAAVW